jgi:hypothetical protein
MKAQKEIHCKHRKLTFTQQNVIENESCLTWGVPVISEFSKTFPEGIAYHMQVYVSVFQ